MEKSKVNKAIGHHLIDCYNEAKIILGENFESCMADLTAEILLVQGKCKPGTSFVAAGMLLSLPDENDTPDEVEKLRFIRAAICWYILEKGGKDL